MPEINGLTGEALRIATDKPDGWTVLLLTELVEKGLREFADLRMQHLAGLAVGEGRTFREEEMPAVLGSAGTEAQRLLDSLQQVTTTVINAALTDDDIEKLRIGAKQVVLAYQELLEWSSRLRRAHVPAAWRGVIRELSKLFDDALSELDSFSPRVRAELQSTLACPGEWPKHFKITLTLETTNMENYRNEMRKLRASRGLPE
jgi:hypothetical protein